MLLGVHQSFTGLENLVYDAQSIGANTFQFFIRNNRNLQMRPLTLATFEYFNQQLLASDINTYVLHGSYAINPASCEDAKYEKAKSIILSDLSKLFHMCGLKRYVLHPGAYTDFSKAASMDRLVELMHSVAPLTYGTDICLEAMGGMGTQHMSDLDSIKYILDATSGLPCIKLCLDTCHLFVAGIEFKDILKLLEKYDNSVLGAVHVNGTLQYFGSNKDRHSSINDSLLPKQSLVEFVKELYKFNNTTPFILETPSETLHSDYLDLLETLSC